MKQSLEMNCETALVVGTARRDAVTSCLTVLAGRVAREHTRLFLKNDVAHFAGLGYRVSSFSGWLSWLNPALPLVLLRQRPAIVVIAIGEHWFHDKVLWALALYRVFFQFELFIGSRGALLPVDNLAAWITTAYCPPLTAVGAAAAALLALAGLGWLLPWQLVLYLAAAAALVELILQAATRLDHEQIRHRHDIGVLIIDRVTSFRDRQLPFPRWCQPDPVLGWWNTPSTALDWCDELPQLGLRRHWFSRTDSRGRRLTSEAGVTIGRPRLAAYGSSFTFGHGVNDHETWPWFLQAELPEYQVLNYACSSYSLIQILLVMEQTIPLERPEIVILGLQPVIEHRNTVSLRRVLTTRFKNPSGIARHGRLRRTAPVGYAKFPASEALATVRMAEQGFNSFRFRGRDSHQLVHATMELILLEIKACCERHGARFFLNCLDLALDYQDFFHRHGFVCCHPGVDLSEKSRWTFFPIDNHPLPGTQQLYARVALQAIKERSLEKPARSGPVAVAEKTERSWQDEIYPFF